MGVAVQRGTSPTFSLSFASLTWTVPSSSVVVVVSSLHGPPLSIQVESVSVRAPALRVSGHVEEAEDGELGSCFASSFSRPVVIVVSRCLLVRLPLSGVAPRPSSLRCRRRHSKLAPRLLTTMRPPYPLDESAACEGG